MKVLVTGANGFLGSWLCRRLAQEGLEIRILCRRSSDLSDLQGITYEKFNGDITNADSVFAAARGIDTIFHLAGLVSYKNSDRQLMEKINVEGTSHAIEAAIKNNVRKFIHISSVCAIGASFDGVPLNEESKFNISHLNLGYFETKRMGEELVKEAAKLQGLDAVILNPSTIYGAGDAKKGSRKIQLQVAQGKLPFYPPGGVSVIAIEDVVEGIWQAWKRGKTGERYILSGENILLKDLFQRIAKLAGVKPPQICLPAAFLRGIGVLGDVIENIGLPTPVSSEKVWVAILYHWFDSTKAQRELGLKLKSADYALDQSLGWIIKQGLLSRK